MLKHLGFGGGAPRGVRYRYAAQQPRAVPGQSALPFHSLPLHSSGRGGLGFGPGLSHIQARLAQALKLRLLKERLLGLSPGGAAQLAGALGTLGALACWLALAFVIPESWGCGRAPFVSGSNCWWLPPRDVHTHFVYVYDIPRRFHGDLLDQVTSKHLSQMHADRLVFSFMQRSNAIRTTNPENASLFFVPVLPTVYLAQLRSQWATSAANQSAAPSAESLGHVEQTSKFVEKALQYVQSKHPYWRRTNGRDHFILASHEYGRCSLLPYLSSKTMGDLFTVQPCGYGGLNVDDLLQHRFLQKATDSASGHRRTHASALEASTSGIPDALSPAIKAVPCFRPGHDLVMPPLHASSVATPPAEGSRPTFLLAIVGPPVPSSGTSSAGMQTARAGLMPPSAPASPTFERSLVRSGFDEIVRTNRPKGWSFLEASVEKAESAMRSAVLCVCLPDATHWQELECITQAVLSGCVPVTFFHDHLHPWLGTYKFEEFTINIDPMDVFETRTRVEVMQLDPPLLKRIQGALAAIQPRFQYLKPPPNNAFDQLSKLLQQKADNLLHGTPLYELQ